MDIHYKTMSELRSLNRVSGGNFFSRDTMRFWGSTVYPNVRTGKSHWYFVTAENQFDSTLPRRYTVRKMNACGDVGPVGKFQAYGNFGAALDAATEAASAEREAK